MRKPLPRFHTIAEVSVMLGLPPHVLRQWEARVPQLKPKRDPAGRRRYTQREIDICRRLKQLVRHERLTLDGARLRIAEELHGEGRPRTRQEIVDALDRIEAETRAMLDLLDSALDPQE